MGTFGNTFKPGGMLYAINPDGTAKWSIRAGAHDAAQPAVGSEGIVYAGVDNQDETGSILALSPHTGEVLGGLHGSHDFRSPCLGPDGTLYAATEDGALQAIRTDSPGPAATA